ncbi:hypothetical protein B0H17DRAFT_1222465 [Mycena rosella]|uniref:Uncharacterized protein n=1 Tax=Mycena rosella TaxID=1033263 RepID=A0AAD7AXJ3_MYCRO|nr:hypothetical protein B0H17DRAFT_1222465 [Mycena rosella]
MLGVSFIILALTSEDALARLQLYPKPLAIPDEITGNWSHGLAALYAFYERSDGVVRTRMFDGVMEDPATGAAASTFSGWLGDGPAE